MAPAVAALLGEGPFYKVSVSRAREATFGAERIVWAVSGKYFSEASGNVSKKLSPGNLATGHDWPRLAAIKWSQQHGQEPPFHTCRGLG